MNRHLVRAVVLVAVALALTGCSPAAAGPVRTSPQPSSSVQTSTTDPVSSPVSHLPTSSTSSTDPETLDGISQDLNSAGNANAQTDADAHSADQATSTSDG